MRAIAAVGAALAVVLAGSAGLALDTEDSRASLKGLREIRVRVEHIGEDLIRAGFRKETFQTDVELKLRLAGIKVINALGAQNAYLYVNVNTSANASEQRAPFSINVQLIQSIILTRDQTIWSAAPTWSRSAAGTGNVEYVRKQVEDLVDIFLNAWLSVNPRQPGAHLPGEGD